MIENNNNDLHRIGMYDSETEWIDYEIGVDDAYMCQLDDINVLLADLERRY